MRKALAVILREGGVANARVFTKIWLALFGIYPWAGVPSLPPELVFFPLWMPFNLYDFACWARGTVAPLTIVVSKKPVRELGVDVREIIAPGTEDEMKHVRGKRHWLMLVERLQKLYERLSNQPKREEAQRRVAEWIVERQEADGSWGGIQPPWVYSLIALDLMGYDLDHPVMRKGLDGMRRFSLDDHARMAFPRLHVAGLGYGVGGARAGDRRFRGLASGDAPRGGLDAARADSRRRARRLADEVQRNSTVTAGPSSSTTTPIPTSTTRRSSCWRCSKAANATPCASAVERGRRWTLAMDCRNGAWAAFDRDNTRDAALRHAVLRLRRDDRSADRRRHRARARDARRARATTPRIVTSRAASSICARRNGRRARGTGAGASTTSTERGA